MSLQFARKLKKEMRDLRIQRQTLAEIIGVSEPMITHFVTGRRKPSPEKERAILYVLHVIVTEQQRGGRYPLNRENIRAMQKGIRAMEASAGQDEARVGELTPA